MADLWSHRVLESWRIETCQRFVCYVRMQWVLWGIGPQGAKHTAIASERPKMATAFLAAKRLTFRAGMKMAPFPPAHGFVWIEGSPKIYHHSPSLYYLWQFLSILHAWDHQGTNLFPCNGRLVPCPSLKPSVSQGLVQGLKQGSAFWCMCSFHYLASIWVTDKISRRPK